MSERKSPTVANVCDLLAAYEMGLLDEAQRRRFETHLDECDGCLEEIYAFAPASTAMTADPGRFRGAAVVATPSWTDRLSRILGDVLRPRILAPVAAAAAVALLVLLPTGSPWVDLAVVEPLPWTQITVRSGEDPAQGLFTQGMTTYLDGRYEQAATTLLRAADLLQQTDRGAPGPEQARLYAGVSLLLARHPGAAKAPLQNAAASPLPPISQGADWYLAQAYLLTDRPDSAASVLSGLSASPVYGARARTLLERLRP